MLSNLVGQYVVDGYEPDTQQYLQIVAVIQDRAKVLLFVKNLDNRIIPWCLENSQIIRETPHQKACNDAHMAWCDERSEVKRADLLQTYEACVKIAQETMSK